MPAQRYSISAVVLSRSALLVEAPRLLRCGVLTSLLRFFLTRHQLSQQLHYLFLGHLVVVVVLLMATRRLQRCRFLRQLQPVRHRSGGILGDVGSMADGMSINNLKCAAGRRGGAQLVRSGRGRGGYTGTGCDWKLAQYSSQFHFQGQC
jgi:hypothetical protein